MSTSNRLTALTCKTLGTGLHADGHGLYLRVKSSRRSWVYIYHIEKRRREMGLGAFGDVTLAEARAKAAIARASVKDGIDPLTARKTEKAAGVTFGKIAADFIELKKPGWRNAKHADQWTNTLRDYAKPISEMEVAKITTTDVLACLKPIWSTKPETASRVRMRIENILDAAKAWGLRAGENPASWSENLVHLLPPRIKLSRGHQRAMPFEDAPAFMAVLRERESVAARALEFNILTAVRTSETLNARWSEIDWTAKVWSIPPDVTP
jgi:hypothetical protein